MSAFEYQALDAQGRTKKGVLEGDTARQIRQKLREQGLAPLAVDAVVQKQAKRSRRGSLNAAELALLTRQLATLIRSGLPLEETLHAVAQQSEKARIESLLMAVRSKVLEGHSLADSLSDFPAAFPDLYCATVSAGEQSGHLDIVLERLADYTEKRRHLRQKTLLALFYPMLLTIVAILVVAGLLAYVVPQVVQVFQNVNQELPWLTVALIQISDFLRAWGLWLLGLSILGLMIFNYLLRIPHLKYAWHRIRLGLPIIGKLEQSFNVARFTRTLSILLDSGVPVIEALRVTAQVMSNVVLKHSVENAARQVREGTSLYHALQAEKRFPPLTVHLIASGEASGNLAEMLERAADTEERDLETVIGVVLGLFEPILILVMGGVVLTIVLAILMPIFELNQLVKL